MNGTVTVLPPANFPPSGTTAALHKCVVPSQAPVGGIHLPMPASPTTKATGEVVLGLATHYVTGIALTESYLLVLPRLGLRPDPIKAAAFGLATAVFPLFVMYPSMGYGYVGRRSGDARRIVSIMLLGHLTFGAGIGLASYQTRGMKRRGTCRRYSR